MYIPNPTYTFEGGVLQIYSGEQLGISQHFNPLNGNAWASEEEALNWFQDFNKPDPALPPVETPELIGKPVKRLISHLAWIRRFTNEEYIQINTVKKTDVALESMLDRMSAAKFIDLDDAEIHAGCDYLISIKIITPERKNQILTAEIVYDELP